MKNNKTMIKAKRSMAALAEVLTMHLLFVQLPTISPQQLGLILLADINRH